MRATRHMMEIVLNRKLRRAEMRFADRHHVRIHVSHTNQIIAVRHSYNGFAGRYRAFFPVCREVLLWISIQFVIACLGSR